MFIHNFQHTLCQVHNYELLFFSFYVESGSPESRVKVIHSLVHKLPEKNKEMLDIVVKHLAK